MFRVTVYASVASAIQQHAPPSFKDIKETSLTAASAATTVIGLAPRIKLLRRLINAAKAAAHTIKGMGAGAMTGAGLAAAGTAAFAISGVDSVKDIAKAASHQFTRAGTVAALHTAVPVAGNVVTHLGAGAAVAAAAPSTIAAAPLATFLALGYLFKGAYEGYISTTKDGKYRIAKNEHAVPLTALKRDDAIQEIRDEMAIDEKVEEKLAQRTDIDSYRRALAKQDYFNLHHIHVIENIVKNEDSPDEPTESRDRVIRFLATPM